MTFPEATTMRAVVQRDYGPPSVLRLADVPRPRMGARDVLVRVHAASITQADRRLRAGDFPGITWLPGRLALGLTGPRQPVPGTSFAGVIEAVGPEVRRWAVGDAVFGGTLHGAHAELLALPEDAALARLPRDLGGEEAAVLPYGAGTALAFLRDRGEVQAGQHVAILGASGGVGRYAVPIAKHLGAEVTAISGPSSHGALRALGADHVVDRHAEDWLQSSSRFDVILDTVGATSFERCRHLLTERGRYLGLVVSVRLLGQMIATSFTRGQRAIVGVASTTPELLDDVRSLVELGAIRADVGPRFPLADISAAHARVEAGERGGTVVVAMTSA